VKLGVDLGTTWTAAAVFDGNAVTPLKLGAAGSAMPSVVAIADGKPVAGDAAVRVGRDATAAVAREFKRRLGDSTPIVLAGTPYGPETLTGHLLAHVVASAASAGHQGAPQVTLAHPATWGEFKLDLLREAGRVAGIGDVALVPEPVAAAGHYARLGRLQSGDAVAVYDFGGGTFDAAIVRLGPDGPELLGRAEGLDRLGGVDLDQAILAHVDAALDGALRAMDRDNPDVRRAALELRAECVAAKEALSADTETTIAVRFPSLNTDVRMTRPEFEAAVRPRVADTLSALDRAIASASLTAGDLTGVVLVGGSSRIPMVAEQVAAHTGRPNLVDADPKLSVAFGAAEPDLRPPTSLRPAPAAVTRESAMPDTTRSTPPPPSSDDGKAATDAAPGARPGAPTPPGAPGAPKAPARTAPSERRTAATNAPKEQSGMSTAAKIAAGVAAAGAATAAGVLWHEDVTDALGITGDEDTATDDTDAAADADAAAAEAESMDAFEAVAPSGGGGGGGGGGFAGGGGGGGGGGGSFAPPRPQARPERPDMAPPSGQSATETPISPEFLAARQQLAERLTNWQPPEGANPEEAAALRTRLEGLLERFQPNAGQSSADAIAELRDEFDVRIDNFTQDAKLDALAEAQNQGGTTPPTPPPAEETPMPPPASGETPTTEPPATGDTTSPPATGETPMPPPASGGTPTTEPPATGDTTNPPTGTETPTEPPAAETPTPTEPPASETPTEQPAAETPTPTEPPASESPTAPPASETPSEPPPPADAAFEARRMELITELENWRPAPGMDSTAAETRRNELLQQVRQAQPVAGQGIEASFPPVLSDPLLFNTGVVGPAVEPEPETPPAAETPPADETPAGDSASTEESPAEATTETPDPRVTTPLPDYAAEATGMPETGLHTSDGLPEGVMNLAGAAASGLVDDFDALAGIGETATSEVDGLLTVPAPAEVAATSDVVGDTMVAEAAATAGTPEIGIATAPVYDQAPPIDDLGLEMPDFAAAVEPEPMTFEEPAFEPAVADFAEAEPDLEPAVADDSSTDDLGLT
jgi:actin-like ATPase involved in cell morphogenesis